MLMLPRSLHKLLLCKAVNLLLFDHRYLPLLSYVIVMLLQGSVHLEMFIYYVVYNLNLLILFCTCQFRICRVHSLISGSISFARV